jgi:hypothetical protein
MRELVLRVLAARFRLPTFGHVDRGSDEAGHLAGGIRNRVADDVEIFDGAVGGTGAIR